MEKQVTQVMLSSQIDTNSSIHMTTWVDADKRLKEGVVIKLKNDDRAWTVLHVYNTEFMHTIDNRGWDNNNYDKHESKSMKERLDKA